MVSMKDEWMVIFKNVVVENQVVVMYLVKVVDDLNLLKVLNLFERIIVEVCLFYYMFRVLLMNFQDCELLLLYFEVGRFEDYIW